jgi:CubicO group peptidase (beta-lactamase class C family)
MFKRVHLFALATTAASASVAQPVSQSAPPSSQPSVVVSREVLERYAGRYALNGTIATVSVTDDGRLTVELAGQPKGPPLRAVGANAFVADATGVELTFEGDGPKANRIRSRYNGGEVLGVRLADPTTAPKGAGRLTVRLFKDWLRAIRKPDDAVLVRFMQAHMPAIFSYPQQALVWKRSLGGLRLHSVRATTADGAELWLFDPDSDTFLLGSATLSAEPDKIATLNLAPTDLLPPGIKPTPKLEGAALIKAIRARLASRDHDFSGAVLLAKGGQVLFEQAYGFADSEARKPNAADTQFRFGSIGKTFTIVAIMQLVQDGKIDLSAPIGRYLTDYPNAALANTVTIANLLTHTGGTGDYFGPEFAAHRSTLRDLQDYVDLFGKRPVQFKPGSRYAYSNYGFILLGRIVEKVSGLGYDGYLQRNIFDPAGMQSTGNLPETTQLPHRAVAYTGFGSALKRADDTLSFRGTSAGGGYATAGDLARFIEAVASHRLLRADTLQTLTSGGLTGEDGKFYPYDFSGTVARTGRFIGHGGGAPGMNGELRHFPDSGYTLVVLANRDPGMASNLASFVSHRLPAK